MALFSKKQTDMPRRRRDGQVKPHERASEASLSERYAFRRNRTLTGSVSSHVASTNESSAQLKSPRVQAHELVKKRRHIGATLLLVLIAAAVLYGLVAQFTADVVVKAQDVSIKLDPAYGKKIQVYLSHRPIERLRFMMDEDALSAYLQVATPEVASIKSDGSAGLGKSALTVTLRQPIAAWSIRGSQQFVDETGTAFARNYFPSPSVRIVDKSGIEVSSGQAVASNRFLGFVGRVVGLAKTNGYTVRQVIIPFGTTRQVELRLAGVGYPVKFSVDRAAGEQIEDMVRSLKWLSGHKKKPEYLDVRISGKAYYR